MKIYKVEFNKYTNGMRDTVSNGAKEIKDHKYLNVGRLYDFLVKDSDLDYYKQFGDGFKKIELVGELHQDNIDSLVINVCCNLVGKEDVEKTIEELENKLKNMKVELTI